MNKQGNSARIFLISLGLFILYFFTKEKKGIYVPEDGEFGDFDTDGEIIDNPLNIVPTNEQSC